jgi:hypothetical protein
VLEAHTSDDPWPTGTDEFRVYRNEVARLHPNASKPEQKNTQTSSLCCQVEILSAFDLPKVSQQCPFQTSTEQRLVPHTKSRRHTFREGNFRAWSYGLAQ